MKRSSVGVYEGRAAWVALAVMAVVVALLPNDPLDPWGVFVPRSIGKLFFAFGLIQVLGGVLVLSFGHRHGRILSGVIGGFVSSTAFTARAARQSRTHPEESLTRAAATLAAQMGMIIQGAGLLFVTEPDLLVALLPVFFVLALGCLGWLLVLRRVPSVQIGTGGRPRIALHLSTQISLTVLIGGLILLTAAGKHWFGQSGATLLTAISSLFEVHGTLVANAELTRQGVLSKEQAAGLIVLGLSMANFSKVVLSLLLGARSFAVWMLLMMSSVTALAWVTFILF